MSFSINILPDHELKYFIKLSSRPRHLWGIPTDKETEFIEYLRYNSWLAIKIFELREFIPPDFEVGSCASDSELEQLIFALTRRYTLE